MKHPRYWGGWLFVFACKSLVLLPFKWQLYLGKFLGRIGYKIAKKRRKITYTNLKACFPEKNEQQIKKLCQQSFQSIGMGFMETLTAWFMSERRIQKINLEGAFPENFDQYNRNAIIFLGCHMHCMELMGRLMVSKFDNFELSLVYQKHKNPFFEYIMTRSRSKYATACLQRKNVYAIIKTLRRKKNVWYAPDQNFGNNEHTAFVPFFGVQCLSLLVTPWLAQKGKATVMPCYYYRKTDLSGYEFFTLGPWEGFPSGDDYQDALRYNQLLENIIKQHPEQYLWQHRRFKTRPEGEAPFYDV